jgi:hypothetical protein
MSNDESIESMARERLTAPGVVNRAPVLSRYDRLQQPLPTSALADRLHQRAAHAEQADGSALVWRRASITANAFLPEPPPSADVGHATTPSVEPPPPSTDVGHATTPSVREPPPVRPSVSAAVPAGRTATPTLVQRLAQRQHAPATVTVADSIQHATGEYPEIAAASLSQQVRARHGVERAAAPPVGRAAVPTTAASAPVGVMRQADLTLRRRAQHTPDVAALRSVTRPAPLPISIARKREASESRANSIPATTAPSAPAIALAPAAPNAAMPLVLRRVAAPVPASPSAPPVPYGIPSSSAGAEELTRAAQSEGTVSAPHAAAASAAEGGHGDIDRIAEEVERRLRQRLEIERERRGIRSWR